MSIRDKYSRIASCAIVMGATVLGAIVWWQTSWIVFVLAGVGLVCLAAMLYAWMTGRRVDRLIERGG